MSIYLQVEPYCEECPDFIARKDTIAIQSVDGEYQHYDTRITCENRSRCGAIYERLRKEIEK